MTYDCPFSSPPQTYGFWLSFLKSFSTLWLLIVPCQVLLKLMSSDCPLSSPAQTCGFWNTEGAIKHGYHKYIQTNLIKYVKFFSNLWLLIVCIYLWCPCLIVPSVFSNVYFPWKYTWISLFVYTYDVHGWLSLRFSLTFICLERTWLSLFVYTYDIHAWLPSIYKQT
jgi:hypothetical protein